MNKLRTISATAVSIATALLIAGSLSPASARNHDHHTTNREVRSEQRVRQQPQQRTVNKVVVQQRAPQSRVVVRHEPTRVVHRALPNGYRTIRVANRPYYYHNGAYYNHCNGGYEVVRAPRIRYLPRHARRVMVNQAVYFVCDDVYYTSYGDYYEVCEAPRFTTNVVLNAGPLSIVLSDDNCHHHY